jgi:hypothetical protein
MAVALKKEKESHGDQDEEKKNVVDSGPHL